MSSMQFDLRDTVDLFKLITALASDQFWAGDRIWVTQADGTKLELIVEQTVER